VTDLPFSLPDPDPTRPERPPAKCRRHRWIAYAGSIDFVTGAEVPASVPIDVFCRRCGKALDPDGAKRGRNNRKRGVSDELVVARILGGRKVGPLGLPWDVVVDGPGGTYLRAQCKKVSRWPSIAEVIAWLDAIPAGPELRAVTLADAPGPGGRTRRLIVLDLAEFARWHGKGEPE
jgi:hypothetical protein